LTNQVNRAYDVSLQPQDLHQATANTLPNIATACETFYCGSQSSGAL